jgi:hypothetical protein
MWINMNETTKDIEGIYLKSGIETQPARHQQSIATLIVLSIIGIVFGLGTGLVIGMFSQLIPIVFLYPVVMGIVSGKMISEVIQNARVRKTSQLLVLSTLLAVAMYGSYHYCRYLGFQLRASFEIFEGFSAATESENLGVTKTFLDYALEEETGHSGFLGYMLYEAKQGVSIGRLTRSSSVNLGPVLTWLYWLVEFGIILGLTVQKGWRLINIAFCESCGNPYGSEKHLGGTMAANESLVLDLIGQKDFVALGKLMEPNADVPSLEVYFQGCEACGGGRSQLVMRRAFQGEKGALQFKDAAQAILQPAESLSLLKQLSFSGD